MHNVSAKLVKRIRAGRNGRISVTAGVIAQNIEIFFKFWQLQIPHREISAQRIAKYQHGSGFQPADRIVNSVIRQVNKGQSVARFLTQESKKYFSPQPVPRRSSVRTHLSICEDQKAAPDVRATGNRGSLAWQAV